MEKNESRLAESWTALGNLYREQGQKVQAREAYNKCIEYPNTSFAYRRSVHYLAVEAIAKKDFENAHAILKQNLDGELRRYRSTDAMKSRCSRWHCS